MGTVRGGRFWEIDLIRGIAIVLMVVFHLVYDLNYFGNQSFDPRTGVWYYIGRTAAVLFIFLVGLSLSISYARSKDTESGRPLYPKYVKRGMWIFSLGMLITLATWLSLPRGTVLFGILHFIGVSIIIAYPFLKNRYSNLVYGAVLILAGLYLKGLSFDGPWLLWLGLRPHVFYTLDYFPILPWFGLVLFGIFAGNHLYSGQRRKFDIPDLSGNFPPHLLCMLGRRSLMIYLIHQPILLLMLHFLGLVDVGVLIGNL